MTALQIFTPGNATVASTRSEHIPAEVNRAKLQKQFEEHHPYICRRVVGNDGIANQRENDLIQYIKDEWRLALYSGRLNQYLNKDEKVQNAIIRKFIDSRIVDFNRRRSSERRGLEFIARDLAREDKPRVMSRHEIDTEEPHPIMFLKEMLSDSPKGLSVKLRALVEAIIETESHDITTLSQYLNQNNSLTSVQMTRLREVANRYKEVSYNQDLKAA